MHGHDFEQKCRGMVLRDTVLRAVTYSSLAAAVILCLLDRMNMLPRGTIRFTFGALLVSLVGYVLIWQNLRCPHCGALLSTYYGAAYARPKHCIHCSTVIRWKKRDAYDLQPPVRETVEPDEMTDELHVKCLEIARRDRVLRPMLWIGFAALLVMVILLNGGPLPNSFTNVSAIICCVYVSVVGILWAHNLRCPVCRHHLTGKYTRNRISLLELPNVHICGHCYTKLPFE
ncbi:MAG: hypothetical protein IJ042_02235 [Butyricicoccus sp.]|nr:hypothetical protein [Butyricicoccus sp.]